MALFLGLRPIKIGDLELESEICNNPSTVLGKKSLFGIIYFWPTLIENQGFIIMPFIMFWPILFFHSTKYWSTNYGYKME